MFFWNSLAFSMILQMLAIWSLVPLPFVNPSWTSGCSQFTYYWSLAWRILSIILLVYEMSAIVWYFEHSLAFLSLGLEWKLTFSSKIVRKGKFFRSVSLSSCSWTNDKIDTRQTNWKKEKKLIHMHRGLIKMTPQVEKAGGLYTVWKKK